MQKARNHELDSIGRRGAAVERSTTTHDASVPALESRIVGEILGRWQHAELQLARGFAECRGLSHEHLEDIYQETALALYSRPYGSEEHLRNALRTGIKQRALRTHRDERRRSQILARNALGLHLVAQAKEDQNVPEQAVIAHEDQLIAAEFVTELTDQEKRVFAWMVEGLQYRAIATMLGISVNRARNAARACERKRRHFQLLYDSGRLCGYRAQTIHALQAGQGASVELAQRAFAHLESCAQCRLEHGTNASRLRRSFGTQVAALLPPVMLNRLGPAVRLLLRTRLLLQRVGVDSAPLGGQGMLRERTIALLAGGSATKVVAAVFALSALAGGTIVTHVLDQSVQANHAKIVAPAHRDLQNQSSWQATPTAVLSIWTPDSGTQRDRRLSNRQLHQRSTDRRAQSATSQRHQPGGFAYLGVPGIESSTGKLGNAERQDTGGPFSP